MINGYQQKKKHLILVCLVLFVGSFSLNAQLTIEREFIGSATGPATILSNGGTQQLKVDDSFGETIIGYEAGEIIVTVGFQQTRTSPNASPPNLEAETEQDVQLSKVAVNAYPNPTIEKLTVDLGEHQDKFELIRIIDSYGRTVKSQQVNDRVRITFRSLDKLANANYFLQGITKDGELHQLTKVLIVTDSSN